ncbi:MBL fold metallo-hydrolase [Microseira sp. BLCC-F43]|jgi:L-ascorbate metabolism protein UlaG (beta-lactamase superfamily)|uniref:MBL fold metallo-hydrolase n=1 Tax=Microseira sp. BLCC-F43 TaxID=3153602 RepID=UPI0035B8B905
MNKRFLQTIRIALLVVLIAAAGVVYPDFFTPQEAIALSSKSIGDYSKYYLAKSNEELIDGKIRVTSFGTTMLLFDDGTTQVMVDGYITRVPEWWKDPQQEVETNKDWVNQALSEYAKVDRLKALFVAHSHFDHALDVAYIAKKTEAQLYGSESTLNIGRGGGVPEDKMTLYDPGKEVKVGEFTVTVLRSQHSRPTPGVNDDLGQVIGAPLTQPTMLLNYVEGNSFDFVIKHRDRSILVKPSANYIWGALEQVPPVNVLFLGMATAGSQTVRPETSPQMPMPQIPVCPEYRDFLKNFYDQTVDTLHPKLVIPIHWDDLQFKLEPTQILTPLDDRDLTVGFDFLVNRLTEDNIEFGIMPEAYQSVILFGDQGYGLSTNRNQYNVEHRLFQPTCPLNC